jgi:hypothetical protein
MDTFLVAGSLISLALGAAMALVAWNVIRANQRREAARVQLLSSLAFQDEAPLPATTPVLTRVAAIDTAGPDEFLSEEDEENEEDPLSTTTADTLFSEPPNSGAAARRRNSFAVVAVAVTMVISMYAWVQSVSAPSETTAVTVEPSAPRPMRVELLALTHDRKSASTFVVSGRLRNPGDGEPVRDLVAVVEVFDAAGRVLATVRAPLDLPALDPGASSSFSVTAQGVDDVAKYRVEFHGTGDQPIAHVDRRDPGTKSPS